jgi:hypothetical protein
MFFTSRDRKGARVLNHRSLPLAAGVLLKTTTVICTSERKTPKWLYESA